MATLLTLVTGRAIAAGDPLTDAVQCASPAMLDSLSAEADALRAAGDLEGAVAVARRWTTVADADPDAPAWRRADARNVLLHLQWLQRRPAATSDALAEADALSGAMMSRYAEGDFATVMELCRQQLAIRRAHLPDDHLDIAETLRRISVMDRSMGHYADAAATVREALSMQRRLLPPDHPDTAKSLQSLALVESARGDYPAAEPLFREGLAMLRRILPADDHDIVTHQHNLAIFLSAKGDHDEAVSLFEEILVHDRQHRDPDSQPLALLLHNLGSAMIEAGRFAEAEPHLRESLTIMRGLHGDASPFAGGSLLSLGIAMRELGRHGEARALLAEAETAYRATVGDVHPHLAEVLTERGVAAWMEGDLPAAEELLTDACEVHEAARLNVGTGYARSEFQVSPYGALAAVQLLLGREDAAWTSTELALGRTLADMLHAAESGDPGAAVRPLPRGEVQRALGETTAIIGWLDIELLTTAHTWIYVLRHDGPARWARIPSETLGEARRDADTLREMLVAAGGWPYRVSETARIDDLAARVHAAWITPVAAYLDGVEKVVALPSGALLGLPLEALRGLDGTLLDDRFAMTYAPSASIYARRRSASDPDAVTGSRALLVGDPPVGDRRLPSLPGARDEVRELAAVFHDATILLGSEATETAFRTLGEGGELAGARWIHLATHALADARHPESSALVLAPDDHADGLLTAAEIVGGCRLGAELVTLSGCRTALGRPSRGEGYVGLSHAFLRAGARNLLVSLWTVDDEATRLLMGRFYTVLLDEARSPAEALRRARRWLRTLTDDDGSAPYAHPAYWSGFVLMGSGQGRDG